MKILYLSELNPLKTNGGGQTIERGVINKGVERGHNIKNLTPEASEDEIIREICSSDFVICCDMDNRPTIKRWFSDNVFLTLCNYGKYATFAHGYCDVCRKDYTPCNLTGKFRCPECPKNDYLRVKFFHDAKINCFISTLQGEASLKHLGLTTDRMYIYTPDMELSEFYDMVIERDIDYLYCGVICRAKGYHEIVDFIKNNAEQDAQIVWVGDSLVGVPEVGKWLKKIPREEMPKIMNRAKNFMQMPEWFEAFSLSAVEAVLCGCNIIGNNNVGAFYARPDEIEFTDRIFPNEVKIERFKDKDRYSGNYDRLWSKLESLV